MKSPSDKSGLKTADKWSDLLRLYETEMSIREIAEHLHVSQTSLYAKIKELGLTRSPRRKHKSIDINKFKELIKLGISDIDIANKLQISTSTVIILKKRHGYATEDEQKISKGKKGAACRAYYKRTGTKPECPFSKNVLEQYSDEIIPLLENGTPKSEIAKRYGVSHATVFNFIHLYDIDAPVKKICDGKEKQIQEAFNDGKSLENISNELKCHAQTIYNTVKNMKLSRAQSSIKRKSILNDREEEIRQLYEQGLSGLAIAKRMGVSYPSLYEFIHKKQFAERAYVRRSVFDGRDDELVKMRQDGMTLKQIGEYFGVGMTTVLHRIKKLQQNNQYQNI